MHLGKLFSLSIKSLFVDIFSNFERKTFGHLKFRILQSIFDYVKMVTVARQDIAQSAVDSKSYKGATGRVFFSAIKGGWSCV